MKTPKASGVLRQAPGPMPTYAGFACMTLLRYIGKIGRTRAGVPLGQIWIRHCASSAILNLLDCKGQICLIICTSGLKVDKSRINSTFTLISMSSTFKWS